MWSGPKLPHTVTMLLYVPVPIRMHCHYNKVLPYYRPKNIHQGRRFLSGLIVQHRRLAVASSWRRADFLATKVCTNLPPHTGNHWVCWALEAILRTEVGVTHA